MKKIIRAFALSVPVLAALSCQESLSSISDRVFDLALQQIKLTDSRLPEGMCPKTVNHEGQPVNSKRTWWCSGFYPGSAWYTYAYTSDPEVLEIARKHTHNLDSLYWLKTDHDLGFQTICSFGNAARFCDDGTNRENIVRNAAKLSSRFFPVAGVIKSWDNKKWDIPVIIDNMMNLELLMEGYFLCGADSLKQIAYSHANTTIVNHFRDDYSCYHLVNYSSQDGQILGKQTVQGYSDESSWARGQAWALYGYTMMARQAGRAGDIPERNAYLAQAEGIARMLLGRLPSDGVPYWDFDDPEIPNSLRDASAAACMASAFVELSQLTSQKKLSRQCLDMAKKQVRTLSGDEYLSKPGENCGFILKHSVGYLAKNSEVDVPLTYADYYFLEALFRLRK
ncbi:MAG: glucuronyl hydrolase [Candidatus Cryptobacteroides sp.]|nr:glucuronyl hydrolase [Candidatus Cryptobacteroides sp.]